MCVPQLSSPAARTARASRAERQGFSGQAGGALRESPRSPLCLAAPCPAASPRGHTPLPIPLPHPPRWAGA